MREQARSKPNGEAFQVKRSDRYLTVPDDVVLHGEERSRRRAEFDAAVGEKERRQKVQSLEEELPPEPFHLLGLAREKGCQQMKNASPGSALQEELASVCLFKFSNHPLQS